MSESEGKREMEGERPAEKAAGEVAPLELAPVEMKKERRGMKRILWAGIFAGVGVILAVGVMMIWAGAKHGGRTRIYLLMGGLSGAAAAVCFGVAMRFGEEAVERGEVRRKWERVGVAVGRRAMMVGQMGAAGVAAGCVIIRIFGYRIPGS